MFKTSNMAESRRTSRIVTTTTFQQNVKLYHLQIDFNLKLSNMQSLENLGLRDHNNMSNSLPLIIFIKQ